jgi:hypothetical protein
MDLNYQHDRLEQILEKIRNKPKRTRGRKLIEKDGKSFRMRRGVLVEIPAEWVGHVTHKQTIRKRPAKDGQGPSYKSKAQR